MQSATGIVELKGEDMAKDSGVSGMHISSMIQILTGAKVIERAQSEDATIRIALLGDNGHPNFEAVRSAVAVLGLPDPGSSMGHYILDQNQFYRQFEQRETTVKAWLRQWGKENLVHVIPPYRGSTTKVIGDLSLVDMDQVELRGEEARAGYNLVEEYHTIPDADKHDYLEHKFYDTYGPTS